MTSEIPVWLGGSAEAVAAVTALWLGIRGVRAKGAETWPTLLVEISKLSNDELRTAVETHPRVAELVGLAWEEAARTSSEQKRHLLARVAAAAIRYGPLADKIKALPFLIRTVANLEPPHIQVMMDIATAVSVRRTPGKDPERDLSRRHALGPLATPIFMQLQREGLIEQVGTTWDLTHYGWEFLAYLADDESAACVPYVDFYSLSRDGQTGELVLMNYGTASAVVTAVQARFYDSSADIGGDFLMTNFATFSLRPKERHRLSLELPEHLKTMPPRLPLAPVIIIQLQWMVTGGAPIEVERAAKIPSFDEKGSWSNSSSSSDLPG